MQYLRNQKSDSKFEAIFEKFKQKRCLKIHCFIKDHPTSHIYFIQYLRNQKLDSKSETRFEKFKQKRCPKISCFLKNHPTSHICFVQYLRNKKMYSNKTKILFSRVTQLFFTLPTLIILIIKFSMFDREYHSLQHFIFCMFIFSQPTD